MCTRPSLRCPRTAARGRCRRGGPCRHGGCHQGSQGGVRCRLHRRVGEAARGCHARAACRRSVGRSSNSGVWRAEALRSPAAAREPSRRDPRAVARVHDVDGGLAQQHQRILSRGLRFPQLKLHVLPRSHLVGHSHGSVAGLDTDQVAHQEGTSVPARAIGHQLQITPLDTQKQRVTDEIALLIGEIRQNLLKTGHRTSPPLTVTEFKQHVALNLFDRKHGPDRSASLGHHGVQHPVATDRTDHSSRQHLIVEKQ